MIEILRKFWQWCGMTPEEFAINDIDLFSDYAPFNYDENSNTAKFVRIYLYVHHFE